MAPPSHRLRPAETSAPPLFYPNGIKNHNMSSTIQTTLRRSISLSEAEVIVQVVNGGALKSRKGINVPELQIDCSALTVKDREDAACAPSPAR